MIATKTAAKAQRVSYHADVVTEQDKLHLVMQVADEVGRKYRIDPTELWGAGWLTIKVAEVGWRPTGSFLAYARRCLRTDMRKAAMSPDQLTKRRPNPLTGQKN